MSIIRLMTIGSVIEANMLKSVLENENIECFLTNENITSLLPGYNGLFGAGVQLMIEDSNLERAVNLLEETKTDTITCPYCNSENISIGLGKYKLRKIVFAFLSVLVSTPLGNLTSTYYCNDCNSDFK